jgi:hypothetical protein
VNYLNYDLQLDSGDVVEVTLHTSAATMQIWRGVGCSRQHAGAMRSSTIRGPIQWTRRSSGYERIAENSSKGFWTGSGRPAAGRAVRLNN